MSGGALSILYYLKLGFIYTASMTQYEMIEISNQQQERSAPHMPPHHASSALRARPTQV